jgi:hypothetical protein
VFHLLPADRLSARQPIGLVSQWNLSAGLWTLVIPPPSATTRVCDLGSALATAAILRLASSLGLWPLSVDRRLSIHLLAPFPPVSILDQTISVRPSLAATESMDETRQQTTDDGSHSISLTDLTGLGIDISSATRTSEGSDLDTTPHRKTTPDSTHLSISPLSAGGFSGSAQYGQSPANIFSPDLDKNFSRTSTSYPASLAHQSLPEDPEASLLHKHHSGSLHSTYGDFAARHKCESIKAVKGSRRSWLSIITILLSVYSTLGSGAFLFIALSGYVYETVCTTGRFTPASAALITNILAKTIELSFVTVIVAMLGQELSRKASSAHRRSGVTLAELNMRSWIVQPGTMVSRWESVRYAGVSTLGLISVASALLAMLYTSASTGLVQPQLKFGKWKEKEMHGYVQTKFANELYIQKGCFTPIGEEQDPVERSPTCLSIEHAAMGYKNYHNYLGMWQDRDDASSFTGRPNAVAWLNNETTVIAPWVGNEIDHTAAFMINPDTGIVINNVSLAFPHTGVAGAAKAPINIIMQPEDLDGVGRYNINASVASPLLHTLCATVSAEHLAPIIFETWNATQEPLNHTTWPAQLEFSESHPSPFLGGTVLDDIFEWGEKYGDHGWPPVFMKYPQAYNTMFNGTGGAGQQYGRTSIYVLGKSNSTHSEQESSDSLEYFLCQLQVSQTPYCYTSYQASGQGAVLEAVCNDSKPSSKPSGSQRYIDNNPDAPASRVFADRDWPMIASEMARALSLNDGAFDGQSSNTRLLSQLLLRSPALDPERPSLAEALAVLAGCTLLQSTLDAPFVHYWEYNATEAPDGMFNASNGKLVTFNASISAQQYASGGTAPKYNAFFPVLLGVFALNVVALAYFLTHKTWYVDFSEPPNLFSLAVNSPPSEAFAGCCGTGPSGKDYGVAWTLEQDQGHVFVHSGPRLESAEGCDGAETVGMKKRRVWTSVVESPVVKSLGRMRTWKRSP